MFDLSLLEYVLLMAMLRRNRVAIVLFICCRSEIAYEIDTQLSYDLKLKHLSVDVLLLIITFIYCYNQNYRKIRLSRSDLASFCTISVLLGRVQVLLSIPIAFRALISLIKQYWCSAYLDSSTA